MQKKKSLRLACLVLSSLLSGNNLVMASTVNPTYGNVSKEEKFTYSLDNVILKQFNGKNVKLTKLKLKDDIIKKANSFLPPLKKGLFNSDKYLVGYKFFGPDEREKAFWSDVIDFFNFLDKEGILSITTANGQTSSSYTPHIDVYYIRTILFSYDKTRGRFRNDMLANGTQVRDNLLKILDYIFFGKPISFASEGSIDLSTKFSPILNLSVCKDIAVPFEKESNILKYDAICGALKKLYDKDRNIPNENIPEFFRLACQLLDCCYSNDNDIVRFGVTNLGTKQDLKKWLKIITSCSVKQMPKKEVISRTRGSYKAIFEFEGKKAEINDKTYYLLNTMFTYYIRVFEKGLFDDDPRTFGNEYIKISDGIKKELKGMFNDIELKKDKEVGQNIINNEKEFFKGLLEDFDSRFLLKNLKLKKDVSNLKKVYILLSVLRQIKGKVKFIFNPSKEEWDKKFVVYDIDHIYNYVLAALNVLNSDEYDSYTKRNINHIVNNIIDLVICFVSGIQHDNFKPYKRATLADFLPPDKKVFTDAISNKEILEKSFTEFIDSLKKVNKDKVESHARIKGLLKNLDSIKSRSQDFEKEFKEKVKKLEDELKAYAEPIAIDEKDSEYKVIEKETKNSVNYSCSKSELDSFEKQVNNFESKIDKSKEGPTIDEITSRENYGVSEIETRGSADGIFKDIYNKIKEPKLYYISEKVKSDAESYLNEISNDKYKIKFNDLLKEFKKGNFIGFEKFSPEKRYFTEGTYNQTNIDSACDDWKVGYFKFTVGSGRDNGLRVLFGLKDGNIYIFYAGMPFHAGNSTLKYNDIVNANAENGVEIGDDEIYSSSDEQK